MSDQNLLNRANALIQSDQLKPKAKAFLLLKLCQLYTLMGSELSDVYWQQLQPLQQHLGKQERALMEELRASVEEEEDPTKGFAGEKIAEIKAKVAEPGLTEAALREFLDGIAQVVEKRLWPGGKQAVWEYLVQVWKTIDRKHALSLTAKLSKPKRKLQVRQMNQESPLTVEEWQQFAEANSEKNAIQIIDDMLEDPKVVLIIPQSFIVPVVSSLTTKLYSTSQTQTVLDQINKFLAMVSTPDTAPQVFDALKEAANSFAISTTLNNQWPEKFNGVLNIIILGVKLNVLTLDKISDFVQALPKFMADYGTSSCYALLSGAEDLKPNLDKVLKSVTKSKEAEAWFLVVATQKGFGEQAYALAKESTSKQQLVPRICRAWLSNSPEAAAKGIDPADIQDDLVAQTLAKTDKKERVAFLRELTQNGTKSLPGGMWVSEAQEEEAHGFWGSLFSSGATLDEIIQEYLKRNPLYVSYRPNTEQKDQFKEFMRFNGNGEYSARQLDPITLESLILWAEEHPEEVKQQLDLMWQAIEPDNNILKVDFLRNAIFDRCITVLAADPEGFNAGFVSWLKKKLVDNSIVWQVGKTQYTVHYPQSALPTMCLRGAIATQNLSPYRRDKLVEIALTQYQTEDNLAELGAQLYNTDKTPLDIEIPWTTKSNIVEGWQMGIVKNAVPAILQEVALNKEAGE